MRLNVVLAQVISDRRADVDGHNAHGHIKRSEDLPFKLLRHIQPRARKAPGGVR
ncbi:hypothetical protein D3C78_1785040 [compost metagenome]